MSFSEPGRDDGNLPPVNIVIPDDARELDRDVLAYRRELRASRRRQRLLLLLRPFRTRAFGGPAAIIPLIAACLAVSLVGGAVLSVATMTPTPLPTQSGPRLSPQPAISPADLGPLPTGNVQVDGRAQPVQALATATIAIVPANCDCGTALGRLAKQAVAAQVGLYFAGDGAEIPQLPVLTSRYGDGAAVAMADVNGVLSHKYHPLGLTVVLVFKDATAEAVRNLSGGFQLTPVLQELKLASTSLGNI